MAKFCAIVHIEIEADDESDVSAMVESMLENLEGGDVISTDLQDIYEIE